MTLPFGAQESDLTQDIAPVGAACQDSKGTTWRIVRSTTPGTATYTCTPETVHEDVTFDDSRKFTLVLSSIPATRSAADAQITVTEDTATGTDWTTRSTTTHVVATNDTTFFFRDFCCLKPQVLHGQRATLVWEGSPVGTEYHLSWDDTSKEVTGPSYTTHPLYRTTTFVLDARTRSATGQVIHHYLSTTVTVRESDVEANNLTLQGTLQASKFLSTSGTSRNPIYFLNDITVTGNVRLPEIGPTSTVFTDRMDAGSGERIEIPGTTVDGALTVNGNLEQNGSWDSLGPYETYTAPHGPMTAGTAGLLIGQIATVVATSPSSLTITAGPTQVSAHTTPNLKPPGQTPGYSGGNAVTMLMVRKGESFTLAKSPSSNPAFYWVPLGSA
ncbi:hypothetical protein ACFVXG_22295 [Kitasatospora sp. NPDC058162]|uniref:hypothetical protein n=1 Tax=Kitasatospora sp. NPDC058162 TaxID=3346362 RepID=UPI0036D8A51C